MECINNTKSDDETENKVHLIQDDKLETSKEQEQAEGSYHDTLIVTLLCLVTFAGNSAYSSVAPFYPGEAVKKGVDESYVGFIFAGYSLAIFVFSPLYGKLLTEIGRKNILMVGCFC